MAGWKPALRIARRDAWRKGSGSRGRSVLVLVMIALPVLAVSAADVVYKTSEVSSVESLDRRLGHADAQISVDPYTTRVIQWVDPERGAASSEARRKPGPPATLDDIRTTLGRDVPATTITNGSVDVDTGRGVANVGATELDPSSPLTDGLVRLTDGAWPSDPSEVVVNAALADKGFAVGSSLTLHKGATLTVSGIGESAENRSYPTLLGVPGSLGLDAVEGQATWLVGGGPVSWDEVLALNAIGASVLSRQVVEHPPPDSEKPEALQQFSSSVDEAYIAALVLVVVMALLEVVLLAGPAFAVGARRQQRTLALMAASGGTPKQARRVILAAGVVLGATAAALGVVLGLGVGWALLPVVQHFSDSWLGPFEVEPVHLLGIACFGLLSAFLAAVVPAWIASRQDVVAVLAGRRGDRRPGYRSPLVGLVLLLGGIGLSVLGTRGGGEILIATAAVVSVLGMILLVPVVVAVLARFSRRLPLVTRYAVRDAARHRTRTVPAVAAVAATVAGVVALGIANSSDAAESEATYLPQLAVGYGSLTAYGPAGETADWGRFAEVVHREEPSVPTSEVLSYDASSGSTFVDVRLKRPGVEHREMFMQTYAGSFGNVLAGPALLALATPLHPEDLDDARRTLDQGGVVVFTDEPVEGDRISVSAKRFSEDDPRGERLPPVELPAYFLQVRGYGPAVAIVAVGALDPMGLKASTAGLLLDARGLSAADEESLAETLRGIDENAYLYVERGYQKDNSTVILLGILFGLGAVLMLGGTLTATFLALSDARPDLATLSAVGAAPRTRRAVAAAYALVVGFVGAVLGAAVGFIPGIAISYPLTSGSVSEGDVDAAGHHLPTHFLDVPWAWVLGLVVVLPLVTALIVGLTARSRLPLVARLD